MNPELQMKQQQFNSAMALYESSRSYRFFGKLISVIIIVLQIVMVYQVIPLKIGIGWQLAALFIAFWLAGMMMMIIAVNQFIEINSVLLHMICYFSIFSVLAEVAHYLCHSPYNRTAELLQKAGLLLNRKHHGRHHLEDNVNYAFLNGMSDGLINFIAKTFYRGYKNNTDRHFDLYTGGDTSNRE